MNASVIESLRIVEPIALGMITFAAGEQLHFSDIRVLSGRHFVAIGLETVLPVVLVGIGAWLLTRRLEVALPVAAIAGTTGLATVMSTLKESGAKGTYAKLLGFAIAGDNFFAILAFSLILPLVVGMETGGAIGNLYSDRLLGMLASVAIGFIAGFIVSRLIRTIRSSHELSMFVLAHVLLVVGVTKYLGFSVLLAGLTMGITAVNLTSEVRDRERAFGALRTLEFPVIAMFFLWAGASLHIRALGSIGLLFAVYVVARAVGKLAGPLATAWGLRKNESQSRRFVGLGVSLLPQAGAAVGLGILAREALPESGETILATVLAAVVVFELIGPMGVHWAVRHAGEAQRANDNHPLTLEEAIKELQTRKPRIAAVIDVGADTSALDIPRLLATRLTADLIVIPFGASATPGLEWWLPTDPEVEPVSTGPANDAPGCQTTETTLAPVLLRHDSLEELEQVLDEQAPDILLVSPGGQSAKALLAAQDVSERLGCPVLEIPVPKREPARRFEVLPRATAALGGLAGWLRTTRGRGSRRAGRPLPAGRGDDAGSSPEGEAPAQGPRNGEPTTEAEKRGGASEEAPPR